MAGNAEIRRAPEASHLKMPGEARVANRTQAAAKARALGLDRLPAT